MRKLPALPVLKSNSTLFNLCSSQKTVNRSVGSFRQFEECFIHLERAIRHSVEVINHFVMAFKCSVKAINRSEEPANHSEEAINHSEEAIKYNLLYFNTLRAFPKSKVIQQTRYNRLQTHF